MKPSRFFILCALVPALALAAPAALAAAQLVFTTPEAAMQAFIKAVEANDEDSMQAILGRNYTNVIPPAGADDRAKFLAAWAKSHKIEAEDQNRAHIAVGDKGWTLPLPLVKGKAGWKFDMKAAAVEIRLRAIGENELTVMKVALAYYDAQKDYAEVDRNGDGILEYAQKFKSSPGQQDGLYWPVEEGQPTSPMGDLVAQATAEGRKKGEGYHGYHYRILKAQGPAAPGGAQSYVLKGRMIGGFALVAWPVRYGETGVMTFIVSHHGEVYEKNLGQKTTDLVAKMTTFNPDKSWGQSEKPLTPQ